MKYLIFVSLLFTSCAKLPIQAVELSQALKDEGDRMHQMNLDLVEYVFNEKKHLVNDFITNEYSPAYIENFMKMLPPSTDVKKDFLEIMQAINPRINVRRDSLLQVLHEKKMIITQKLQADYKLYDQANEAMLQLLTSASKLNQQRVSVYQNIKKLSGNRINLQGIDSALNQFIKGAGAVSEKTVLLSNSIDSFLK